MPPSGYQQQWVMRPKRVYPIETKPFFLTSEFVVAVLAIVGIAITAAASEAFGAWRAWILITAVVVGYMVSRGIASRAPARTRMIRASTSTSRGVATSTSTATRAN